jgi:uncharacterized protein (DUF427 family)
MPERPHLEPGPDHPITVAPAPERVTASVGDRTIVDSVTSLVLREADYPPVYYFPRSDVVDDLLRPSDSTTYCPYKGEASYYSIVTADGELTDAVWSYRDPYPAVAPIAGHVAFYPDRVAVRVG